MFWEYRSDGSGALLDTLDAALRGVDVLPLSGVWRFALDPGDEGLSSLVGDGRVLADRIRFPGVLQAQGKGDDVSVDTRWTGQIVDRTFFTSPTLRALPPAREREGAVLAAAGQDLRRAGVVPARRGRAGGLGGPARRASPRAAALADARVGGRPARRLERQPLDAARVRPRHGARTRPSPAHDPRRQPARGRRGRRTRTASPTTRRATGTASSAGSSCGRRAPCTSRTCRRSRAWRPRRRCACAAGSATRRASRAVARAARGDAAGEARRAGRDARRSRSPGSGTAGAFEAEVPLSGRSRPWDEFSPLLHRLQATLETGAGRDTRDGRGSACARSRPAARRSR